MGAREPSPLQDAVEEACRGQADPLHTFLIRHSGLPGEQPNLNLARKVAGALEAKGSAGRKVLEDLRRVGLSVAPAHSAAEILPVVGVVGIGLRACSGEAAEAGRTLGALQDDAEDPRPHVRNSVVQALRDAIGAHRSAVVEGLSGWTDGYFQGCAVLQVFCDRHVLEVISDPAPLLSRLQECFDLLDKAPRAHERSHGYRSLMRSLPDACAWVGKRFPTEIADWLTERAQTQRPDLREAIVAALQRLRAAGVRRIDVQRLEEALKASAPVPRDPRWDVGPTRARGGGRRRR